MQNDFYANHSEALFPAKSSNTKLNVFEETLLTLLFILIV
jgi:hypothetical protein